MMKTMLYLSLIMLIWHIATSYINIRKMATLLEKGSSNNDAENS